MKADSNIIIKILYAKNKRRLSPNKLKNKGRNKQDLIHKERRKVHMQTLFLLTAQQKQSMYAEAEDQWEHSWFISCLHPQPVGVSPQRHTGGAEQLFCQLEGLVVLQRDRKRLDGERLAALL